MSDFVMLSMFRQICILNIYFIKVLYFVQLNSCGLELVENDSFIAEILGSATMQRLQHP